MKHFFAVAVRSTIMAACLLAVVASTASAATIRYDIPETAVYTVDNTEGIAKVTFNGCVTQGLQQTISFTTVLEGTSPGNATYKVLQDASDEGELPAATFNPATVAVTGESPQSIQTTLSFTLNEVSASGTVFRFKLDAEPGVGLGEGPGVMVDINCVQPAAFLAPSGVPPTAAKKPVPVVPVPTAVAGLKAGPARCIALRRVTLRAGQRSRVTVIVSTAQGRVNHAYVRIKGLGIRKSGFTNGRGLVAFSIKPTRAGTLVIQSNVCIGADRKAVLGAAAPKSGVAGAGAGITG